MLDKPHNLDVIIAHATARESVAKLPRAPWLFTEYSMYDADGNLLIYPEDDVIVMATDAIEELITEAPDLQATVLYLADRVKELEATQRVDNERIKALESEILASTNTGKGLHVIVRPDPSSNGEYTIYAVILREERPTEKYLGYFNTRLEAEMWAKWYVETYMSLNHFRHSISEWG